jgi:hypothetical protein
MMEQMYVQPEQIVSFEFSRFRLPQYVNEFKPLLFKNGEVYFAVLGSDLKNGICGKGETPEDALMDWNDQLREVLRGPDLDNPAIRYVLETISALKREI